MTHHPAIEVAAKTIGSEPIFAESPHAIEEEFQKEEKIKMDRHFIQTIGLSQADLFL